MKKIISLLILAVLFITPSAVFADISPQEAGQDLVLVKGGCFQMGDTFGEGDTDEKPVHEVCVDNFYMGKHEVTTGEFRKFVNETNYMTEAEKEGGCYMWLSKRWERRKEYNWRNVGFSQTEMDPVVCISWNDANEFIKWLNKKTDKNFRLPTEAEWEYSARSGGKQFKYSWGNGASSSGMADVSVKIGLYDMTGNVWEWVGDWYSENYYKNSQKNNPAGPAYKKTRNKFRVLRGGSWTCEPWVVRASDRFMLAPSMRTRLMGFRLALSAE
ncbi:MAG: SUMF1/EgtB/PvdO family nonheme iron enzyme [Nitrospirae bacterium]|nr:SUMF1/EgtB/PvdO family nonheme iron enzyme [Nitrospirota bacterium]